MITMDSYLAEITTFLRKKGITHESVILNEKTYRYLGAGFMVQYLIEQIDTLMTNKDYEKIFEILGMMSKRFSRFSLRNKTISNITWVERECDVKDIEINFNEMKLYLSQEMIYDHVCEWWSDIYEKDINILSLKYQCLQVIPLSDDSETNIEHHKKKIIGGLRRLLYKLIYKETIKNA